MVGKILRNEVEVRQPADKLAFKRGQFGRNVVLVGIDAIAAKNGPPAVSLLGVLLIGVTGVAIVVLVERRMRVIALNQPAAGRVVLGDRQQQGAVTCQRE